MAQQIRVVVLKDNDVFVAQCLEVDIAAQGRTKEEAMRRLIAVVRAESEEAQQSGKNIYDLGPAPEAFRSVYDSDVVDRRELVA